MVGSLTGRNTIEALATDVLETAPPRFALAGLSMGGIVAMEVIRQAPERVERLALLDTNPLADTTEGRALRDAYIAQVEAGALAAVMRDELKPKYLADGPRRKIVLDLCMDMAVDLGARVFIDQARAIQTRPDQQDSLRQVGAPSLVLCGESDTLCPLDRHELMHNLIAGSELAIVPGAGHLPTLEQPNETNKAFERWLTS